MEHAQRAVMLTAENGSVFACDVAVVSGRILRPTTTGRTEQMVPDGATIPLGRNLSLERSLCHSTPSFGGLDESRASISGSRPFGM